MYHWTHILSIVFHFRSFRFCEICLERIENSHKSIVKTSFLRPSFAAPESPLLLNIVVSFFDSAVDLGFDLCVKPGCVCSFLPYIYCMENVVGNKSERAREQERKEEESLILIAPCLNFSTNHAFHQKFVDSSRIL